MIREKISGLKKISFSKNTKRIMATAAITFAVFAFFIWLGVGLYIYIPAEKRAEIWPVFGMYFVFPFLVFFLGAKRVYGIVNGREEETEEVSEENE